MAERWDRRGWGGCLVFAHATVRHVPLLPAPIQLIKSTAENRSGGGGERQEKKKNYKYIKKKTRQALAHMASRQEPLPPPASASSALPASQPCLRPGSGASEHPLRLPGLARRAGVVPLVGSRVAPGSGGGCRAGWSLSAWLEASRNLERGGSGRRDNRLLCSYLWRPEVGWGFGLQISNQCSLFLSVDGQPWTDSLAGTQGQPAGVEVSSQSYPWGVQSCPGVGGHRSVPPPQNGHDASAVGCSRVCAGCLPLCLAPDSALNLSLP